MNTYQPGMIKTIAIDAATIIPGKGGAGGGIWVFTKNLLTSLDELLQNEQHIKIKVFVNDSFDIPLKHIEIVQVGINAESLLKRLWYAHFLLPRLCKQHGIDVLHKMLSEAPFFYRGKMVVTIHDLIIDFYLKNKYFGNSIPALLKLLYFKSTEKMAVTKSDAIFTNSQSLKEELISSYGNRNVIVTGCGNSVHQQQQLVTKPIKNPIRFYCIAGYYPHKGQVHVIKLLENLVLNYKMDIVLHLRGNFNNKKYFDKIVNEAKQSACSDRIIIEEYVKQHSPADIYNNASALVLLSEYEGFGMPIIEAQALGVPVICSSIPIFKEVSGGFACFVELNDLEKSTGIVYNFLKDEKLQASNIINGFENAKRYKWDTVAIQTLEAYRSIIK